MISAKDRARYAKLEKDPNTRAAIPTKYLSPRYRKVRELNARLATPVTPGSTMTEGDLARRAKAETDLKYGDAERIARTTVAEAQGKARVVPDYFAQYRATLDRARQALDAERQAVVGNAENIAAAAGANQAQSAITQAGQFSGADMGQVQQEAAQAAANRGSLGGSARDVLAASYAGRAGVLDTARTSGVEGRLAQAVREAEGNLTKAISDRQALSKERGDYNQSRRSSIRDSERQSVLERIALNLKEADSVRDAKQAEADRKQSAAEKKADRDARRAQQEDQQDFVAGQNEADRKSQEKRDQAKADADAKKDGKPGKPKSEPAFSRDSRNVILGRFHTIQKLARDKNIKDRNAFKQATSSSRKGWYSSTQQLATSAALDLQFVGRISRANLKALRQMGIYITADGSYWGGGNRSS